DLLVGANHEYSAHGGVIRRSAAFRSIPALGGQHAVELGDLQLGVANHGVGHLGALRLLNVGCPFTVTGHGIDAQADDLGVALSEFGLQARHITEFGGAD